MNNDKNKKFKDMTKKEKAFFLIKFILSLIGFFFLLICLIFTMNTRCLAVKADTIEPNPPGNGIELAGPLASADMWTVSGPVGNQTFTSALPGLSESLGLGNNINYYAAVNSQPQVLSTLPSLSLCDSLGFAMSSGAYVNAVNDIFNAMCCIRFIDVSYKPGSTLSPVDGYENLPGYYSRVFSDDFTYLNSDIYSPPFVSQLGVELNPDEHLQAWVGSSATQDSHFLLTNLGLSSPPNSPFDFSNASITIYLSGFDISSGLGQWASKFLGSEDSGQIQVSEATESFAFSYFYGVGVLFGFAYFVCPSAVFEYDIWNDLHSKKFHVYTSLSPFVTIRAGDFSALTSSGFPLSDTFFTSALGLPAFYQTVSTKVTPTLGDIRQFTADGYEGSFTALTFHSPTFTKNNFTGTPDYTQWVTDLPVSCSGSSPLDGFATTFPDGGAKVPKNLSAFMFGLFLAPFRYVTNFNGILYVDGYVDVDLETSGVGNVSSIYQWFQPFFDSDWFGFTWVALLTVIVGVVALRALLSFFAGG